MKICVDSITSFENLSQYFQYSIKFFFFWLQIVIHKRNYLIHTETKLLVIFIQGMHIEHIFNEFYSIVSKLEYILHNLKFTQWVGSLFFILVKKKSGAYLALFCRKRYSEWKSNQSWSKSTIPWIIKTFIPNTRRISCIVCSIYNFVWLNWNAAWKSLITWIWF